MANKTQTRSRKIIVVGDSRRLRSVCGYLDRLEVEIKTRTIDEYMNGIPNDTAAMLLVSSAMGRRSALEDFVARAGNALRDVRLLVLVEKNTPSAFIRRLYEEGATAIFEWPRERIVLMDYLTSNFLLIPRERERAADTSLPRVVRLRLNTVGLDLGKRLDVMVRNGILYLRGQTDNLWEGSLAQKIVESAPGVRWVDTSELSCSSGKRTDRQLAIAIRSVIRNAGEIEGNTVAVSVSRGKVTLAGTASSPYERTRLEDLVTHVRGVRTIENLIQISQIQKKRDRTVAGAVTRAIRSHYPDMPVEGVSFGGIAVLSGKVPTLEVKKGLKRLVMAQDGVRGVVDKVLVKK